ncbi:MAG TPA: hypothetical protein VFE58_09760 [Tepidisphaeraceae bacterium]|jgi:hypothetical protein|nr:hypothetical protein [Tepidisphaeraceae bacterium]
MSRLDQHVMAVRNRLMLARFLYALAWTTLGLASCVLVAIVVDRLFQARLPWQRVFLYAGGLLAVVFAFAYAVMSRPDPFTAAVAIDERLNLKEKYSTALQLRGSKDLFAQAAVKDAEATAGRTMVETRRYFPLTFPRPAYGTVVVAGLAVAVSFVSPMDLFGHEAQQQQRLVESRKIEEAKKTLASAYVKVDAAAKAHPDDVAIQNAKKELEAMLQDAPKDPLEAQRSAMKALQDTKDAVTQKIQDSQAFANARNEERLFKSMTPPEKEEGPVAEAHQALSEGNFSKAMEDLNKATENFDKMEKKDQEKAARQMQAMAQQLQKMAQNPQAQQQMQQQLQRMGANQQQAQQMSKLVQQSAAGNQQAQQQLQQMAKQMQQQMNNGQGPTPQQQQQIQKMMQQMQAQAATQQQAQGMSKAAQQMAQAMQQAAQQQPGQQQQQQSGQQQQQMTAAQQQMQQQMAAMDAIQKDAQAQQAEAQAIADAAGDAAGQMNGGQEGGKDGGKGKGAGKWGGGKKGNGGGMGGPGNGGGMGGEKEMAPYTIKVEKAPTQDIENGKILAAMLVKAGSLKGESKEQVKEVARAAQQDATDEVDQELIGRASQQAVKGYFNSIEQDASK